MTISMIRRNKIRRNDKPTLTMLPVEAPQRGKPGEGRTCQNKTFLPPSSPKNWWSNLFLWSSVKLNSTALSTLALNFNPSCPSTPKKNP